MKPLFRTVLIVSAIITIVFTPGNVNAQEDNEPFSVGVDVVSSYVWRGVPQDPTAPKGSPNIQPYLSYKLGDLTLGTWGSGSFTGSVKEVDLYASYAIGNQVTVTVTDYNWNFTRNYFDYGQGTDHAFEAALAVSDIASLPLSASLNAFFAGADKLGNGDQAYSTYLELGYSLSDQVNVIAGASLNESPIYGTTGFGVTNVALKISKSLAFTDQFSLPVYGLLGFNPSGKHAYLVAGLSF